MTWKTSKGERVLSEKETKLFCACIVTMLDFSEDPEDLLNDGDQLIVGKFPAMLLVFLTGQGNESTRMYFTVTLLYFTLN